MKKKKTIIDYVRPFYSKMAVGLGIKIVATLFDLGIPWLLAYIIDVIIPSNDIGFVALGGIMMLVCSILAWFGNIYANRMASAVARDTTRGIRHDLFAKISYLSNKDVDKFTPASLISRMTSDTYVVHQCVGMLQRMGVRAPIMLIGGTLLTLTLDPMLTLVMLATMPFAAIIVFFVSKKGVKLYKSVQKTADKMLMVVRENVSGVRVIKALSKTKYERERFKKVNGNLTEIERSAEKTMAVINPAMSAILNLGLVAVILVGAVRVNGGDAEIGVIIAFMNYFTLILQSIMAINRMFTMLSRASASASRIEEVINCESELYELESKYSRVNKKAPVVEFKNVSFKYDTGKFLLKNLNFTVNKGETLGIIGATGSGKSTIIQILMRFYDVTSGEIKVDGVNIKDYASKELRDKFGVAFQNDTIFKDTIGENIKFGREISDPEIKKAMVIAQAKAFIEEQGGLNSPVAIKGANLSGGQKQRLLIARAVAASPEILILDDSSSALDYTTDADMREELRNNLADSTKIIIAQRISSVMQAEQIIVMDKGEIIGIGNHEYLMETCELYREIGISQIGIGGDKSEKTA